MTHIVDANLYRMKKSGRNTGGSDGGNRDDVLRRLSSVETLLGEMRVDIGLANRAR